MIKKFLVCVVVLLALGILSACDMQIRPRFHETTTPTKTSAIQKLSTVPPTLTTALMPEKTCLIVTAPVALNLRNSPGTQEAPLDTLATGMRLRFIADAGLWRRVEYHGRVGYVRSEYVAACPLPSPVAPPAQEEK